MKRRKFLQITVAGGSALALTGGLTSCTKPETEGETAFVNAAKPFELDEMTISDLQAGMQSGKYTARSITELYLERIDEIDKQGPSLNAVIELNPDALSTAGSLALKGSIPAQDSFVAQKLREAGAIILAKANLSEWANFRSSRSTSGWSGRGGQARNPYALDRNPCGSSSGSGVAVAANLCAVAIGTETNGSVVCPSSANGIGGIKPTVGLVGRSGIIPIAHTQDTAGPMARTVSDAAVLLGALTGIDPRDETTKQSEGKSHRDYTQFLDLQGMKGARIGVARNYFGFHDKVDKLMEGAIAAMKEAGAIVVDPADIETRRKYGNSGFEVLLYEFKTDLNKYLAGLGNDVAVHSLQELIEFNEANKEAEMPYFGQEILIQAQEKGDLTSPEYKEALEKILRLSRDEGIDATLSKHALDAIVAPTGGPAWVTDWVNGDHFSGGSSSPAARAGYPNITVPAGFVHGLPVGISFFSRAYSEPLLIKLAYSFEQATKHRRPPQFLPHADFG
jgi:amidase